MKRLLTLGTAAMLALATAGAWSPADAKQRAGFAKLDQVTTPGGSVMCGARRGDPAGPAGNSFTYHVTVKNVALTDGNVVVRYQDASEVTFPILAGGVLHFSGVGGSTNAFDRVIEVTGDANVQLIGTISALFDTGAQEHPAVPGVGLCTAVTPGP